MAGRQSVEILWKQAMALGYIDSNKNSKATGIFTTRFAERVARFGSISGQKLVGSYA